MKSFKCTKTLAEDFLNLKEQEGTYEFCADLFRIKIMTGPYSLRTYEN